VLRIIAHSYARRWTARTTGPTTESSIFRRRLFEAQDPSTGNLAKEFTMKIQTHVRGGKLASNRCENCVRL